MSVSLHVYLSRSQMPGAQLWAMAVRKAARGVELLPNFDVFNHSGFLPCKCRGADSGFEYYAGVFCSEDIEDMELEADEQDLIVSCDFSVGFVIKGSKWKDHETAYVAAACLTMLSGGTLYDPQCGQFSSDETELVALCSGFDGIDETGPADRYDESNHSSTADSWLSRINRAIQSFFGG